jgi:hypothetical protein
VPTVLKSSSLNLLETSGPIQACNVIALLLLSMLLCPIWLVFCVRELYAVLLRRKGGIFLVGVDEITLRLYRETVWHLESK